MITPAQKQVLQRMEDGWALGYTSYMYSWWLQRNGLGRGGDTEQVHGTTGHHLRTNGLIRKKKDGFPTSEFVLTDKGRKELELSKHGRRAK